MNDAVFVKIAKALADPTRRQLIEHLRRAKHLTCSQVCERFSQRSQPTISHHIKSLEAAGIISVRREGQFHVLSLNDDTLREFSSQCLGQGESTAPALPVDVT